MVTDNQTPDPTPALLPPARLAEIRERESRATTGPWRVSTQSHDDRPRTEEVCDLVNDTWVVTDHHLSNYRDDAAFIANARQDIPDLLAHLAALQAPAAEDGGEALRLAADRVLRVAGLVGVQEYEQDIARIVFGLKSQSRDIARLTAELASWREVTGADTPHQLSAELAIARAKRRGATERRRG